LVSGLYNRKSALTDVQRPRIGPPTAGRAAIFPAHFDMFFAQFEIDRPAVSEQEWGAVDRFPL
jgi:hypothetical protein